MSSAFGQELARKRSEMGMSLAQVAQLVPCHRSYIAQLERGDRRPSPEFATRLDAVLGAGGDLASLQPIAASHEIATSADDDEFEALEFSRRVAASDIGNATLTALELAADRLAMAYQGTAPATLLPEVHRYLRYVGELIDKRATLDERRRLLVVGGWLSLIAGTLDIDLRRRPAATARLVTAASLAAETGHREIAAWCLETQAWDALTDGRFKAAVELSQAAQRIAPRDGSAFIQATAQEGRAWARLGGLHEARNALDRVERLASPLAVPDQPEHHFHYDPAKQAAYTVTTLSWLADPAAERYAREVLARLESGQDGGLRPRRVATARLDLALSLTRIGSIDEAASLATEALRSGRIVPSSAWRAAEILAAVEVAGIDEANALRDAYGQVVNRR